MKAASWVLACLLGLGAAACGGTVDESSPEGGNNQSGSGSAPGTGGPGSGGGPQTSCCLAAAVCNEGDTEIASKDDCPDGVTCYSNSICCSTVWCASASLAHCDAVPTCGENEVQVKTCPEGATCETRSLCGTSILCQLEECDPEAEPHRTYVLESPAECTVADFACDANTTSFSNACGCGCEAPPACPEYLNCQPIICHPTDPPDCVDGQPADRRCDTNECPDAQRQY